MIFVNTLKNSTKGMKEWNEKQEANKSNESKDDEE